MIDSKANKRQKFFIGGFLVAILATIFVSMGLGDAAVSYDRIGAVLSGNGTFKEEFVFFDIRLPRILVTLLAGMALALSGALLQGITRNDLADPGIIGINSGAGVAVAIYFLFFPIEAGVFIYALPVIAFLGAFLTAAAIYIFSYDRILGVQPVRLVLVGVGFSMALSGLMVLLISSADREKVDFIARWLAGDIWGTDWPFIWALLPWIVVLVPVALLKAYRLNILGLGEQVAIGLGLPIERERMTLSVIAVALAASAVSVTGGISFVGLMAPHIARQLVGPRHQLFLPISLLIGGLFLLIADTIGRTVLDSGNVPAGVIVALIGAPYFVYLLMAKR